MGLKEWVFGNPFVRLVYKARFYLNLGIVQISWFSGKLPEIMSVWWLSEKLGLEFTTNQFYVFALGVTVGLAVFGFFWYNTGLYHTEVFVNAEKDPVAREILSAARKINKKFK